MTELVKIEEHEALLENPKILKASNILKNNGLVVFPTETVYGIGANALSEEAVRKIFLAKGRPQDNPLIVHIADKNQIQGLAIDIPPVAFKLMEKFWPGPLTLVLKKSQLVPSIVTANLETIAIRMPENKIALSLIKAAGIPIAAPSANLSGKPSPTKAEHVITDLSGKVDCIIDGSSCSIGIESTVLDLTSEEPRILRPGKITLEDLREVITNITLEKSSQNQKPISPGMKYNHYSPNAEVILLEGNLSSLNIEKLVAKFKSEGKKVALISRNQSSSVDKIFIFKDNQDLARNLFNSFRDFDKEKIDIILVESIKEQGLGVAIMNRLKKAASRIIMV